MLQSSGLHSATSGEAEYFSQLNSQSSAILSLAGRGNYRGLITKTTAFRFLCENYLNFSIVPERSYWPTLYTVNENSKIECIRKISDARCYVIYKTENQGLFYLFFESGRLDCAIFSVKALNYKDFSTVGVGSTMNDVASIDPIVSKIDAVNKADRVETKSTKHLLKDGLLVLSYTKKSNGAYVVSDKQYYKSYKIADTVRSIGKVVCDYSILPQDYPEQ